MRKIVAMLLLPLAFLLLCATDVRAEGNALYIDTTYDCDGRGGTYEGGYVPAVESGQARFVLPLRAQDTALRGASRCRSA